MNNEVQEEKETLDSKDFPTVADLVKEQPKDTKPKSYLKLICLAIVIPIILIIAGCTWLSSNSTGSNDKDALVLIERGWGSSQIADALVKAQVVDSSILFKIEVKRHNLGSDLKAGYYLFTPHMTVSQVVEKLASGKTEKITVTIPEGFDSRQITDLLVEKKLVDKDKFIEAINRTDYPYEFLKDTSITSLEGYLFPATYKFGVEDDENNIILQMLEAFKNNLPKGYEEQARKQGKTMHEIVTLASLVEKEGMKDDERPIIAGVFYNRLAIGMKLQSCVTVQYALGNHKEKLTNQDIKVESPYNTYLHAGLPPGPIASPGRPSIEAALNPEKTPYLFFVAKGDGSHYFSRTFNEHLAHGKKGNN